MKNRCRKLYSVSLGGFRGLQGDIVLGAALNIVVGPNTSGKTALLEAALTSLTLNFTDIRFTNYFLHVMHASRGSQKHSLASIVPSEEAPVNTCVELGGKRACVRIHRRGRQESRAYHVIPVIDMLLEAERRQCKLLYTLGPDSLGIRVEGKDCSSQDISVGYLTPGVMPYNFFDRLLGKLKRERRGQEDLNQLTIELAGKKFTVDLASDDWDEMAAYVTEYNSKERQMVVFYSVGRGIQRGLQYLIQLRIADIILVDEIESAMHPELLEIIADKTANAVKNGKQVIVTTQSLEAARMLAGALITKDRAAWRSPAQLLGETSHACNDPEKEEELEELLALVVLDREDSEIRSMRLTGCSALTHIAGSRDIRLSYTLL